MFLYELINTLIDNTVSYLNNIYYTFVQKDDYNIFVEKYNKLLFESTYQISEKEIDKIIDETKFEIKVDKEIKHLQLRYENLIKDDTFQKHLNENENENENDNNNNNDGCLPMLA